MKRLLASCAISAMAVCAGLVGGGAANAATPTATAPAASTLTQTVTGTVAGGGTFVGTLSNLHAVNTNGVLSITGNLTGTLTDAAGNVIGTVTNTPITLPVTGGSGTCQILHLDLGPLDLNLLGLQVHLNEVVLDITAQSGPGNLLGNLLCGVAHLLDGSGASGLGGLATLLNQLLGSL